MENLANIGYILVLGLGIAISPVPIIVVILILFSDKAKTNGIAFLGGMDRGSSDCRSAGIGCGQRWQRLVQQHIRDFY